MNSTSEPGKRRAAASSAVPLACEGLRKDFGGVRAVDGVSLGFERGKVTALIGPNGAGKTTLFHLIAGAMKPDAGAIRYCGDRIDGLAPWEVARRGIGRLFQDVRVFEKLTVLENLLVAIRGQSDAGPLGALFLRGRAAREESRLTERARTLLDSYGLGELADRAAAGLSFGQQKLLGICRLMAAEADVFLLDEPTAGVHPSVLPTVMGALGSLADQAKTVIVIEHDMKVVLEIADRVDFMDEGRILASGPPRDVLQSPSVREAYLGPHGAGARG
jgi:ABC-type branched-subunit amino acid transport system ATPase component